MKDALERRTLSKTSGCGCSIIRSVQASADSDSSNPVLWLAFFSVFILQMQAYFNGASLSFLISFAARGEESIPKPSQLLSCMARRQSRVICPVAPWSSCDIIVEKVASILGKIQPLQNEHTKLQIQKICSKQMFVFGPGFTSTKRPNLAGFPRFDRLPDNKSACRCVDVCRPCSGPVAASSKACVEAQAVHDDCECLFSRRNCCRAAARN